MDWSLSYDTPTGTYIAPSLDDPYAYVLPEAYGGGLYGLYGGQTSTPYNDPMEPDYVQSWTPGQRTQQPVVIPQYFTRGSTQLSPYANAVLASLFPHVATGWRNMPTEQWILAPAGKNKEGEIEPKAKMQETVIANPVLPSAQSFRRLEASGAMPSFQNYLGIVGQTQTPEARQLYKERVGAAAKGEGVPVNTYLDSLAEDYKQAFLQQARALWPMENKRTQANWRVAKQ